MSDQPDHTTALATAAAEADPATAEGQNAIFAHVAHVFDFRGAGSAAMTLVHRLRELGHLAVNSRLAADLPALKAEAAQIFATAAAIGPQAPANGGADPLASVKPRMDAMTDNLARMWQTIGKQNERITALEESHTNPATPAAPPPPPPPANKETDHGMRDGDHAA